LNKIKKGDEVIVLTGKDKGRRGQVLKVIKNRRVLIENINLVKNIKKEIQTQAKYQESLKRKCQSMYQM